MAELWIYGRWQGRCKKLDPPRHRLEGVQMARGIPCKPSSVSNDNKPFLEGPNEGDCLRGLSLRKIVHFERVRRELELEGYLFFA